jgi:hypothetical protein
MEFDDDDHYESRAVNDMGQDCLYRTWKEAHEALGLDKQPDWFEQEAQRRQEAGQAAGGVGAGAGGGEGGDVAVYDFQEGYAQVPAAPAHISEAW